MRRCAFYDRSLQFVSRVVSARIATFVVAAALLLAGPIQASILGSSWELDPTQSSIKFQSVKNGTKVETSGFATFSGGVDPTGEVTMRIELDSVDTKVDLRNVRMRFLFFETYKFPTATVTARLEEGILAALESQRRLQVPIEFELDLHGVTQTLTAETVLTMFADDQVAINTSSPVTIDVADFDLLGGVEKLQEAADVQIVPTSSVLFDLTFKKQIEVVDAAATPAAVETEEPVTPVALETDGDFSSEECIGRFEILSRSDAINFDLNSSDIRSSSFGFLDSLTDIVNRCPDMNLLIEGHTDSRGSDDINMQISTSRANSVYQYLIRQGVSDNRLRPVGYGESRPRFPNDTRKNRARNRRIEFVVE